jgi:transposase
MEGTDADHLIADKGYDTDAILELAQARGMTAVIPPKKNRTVQRPYDEDLYKVALLPGKWVHEARETAFLEDRSVNSACEVV